MRVEDVIVVKFKKAFYPFGDGFYSLHKSKHALLLDQLKREGAEDIMETIQISQVGSPAPVKYALENKGKRSAKEMAKLEEPRKTKTVLVDRRDLRSAAEKARAAVAAASDRHRALEVQIGELRQVNVTDGPQVEILKIEIEKALKEIASAKVELFLKENIVSENLGKGPLHTEEEIKAIQEAA